jgi:ABC-2 type transport system permease protein
MANSLYNSYGRINAMTLRYWYLLRGSWPRMLELIYWPTMNMIVWGFINYYLSTDTYSTYVVAGSLIAAVMLWDVLFRGQLGFTFSFLEEVWSRNVANLMISPLHPAEFAISLMFMSLIRLILGMLPVSIFAMILFGFNIYHLGFALVLFFANLVMTSWAVGLVVSGLILRNGVGAQNFAWSVMMLLLPVVCVYYPVSVLPLWLQKIAWGLPPTCVFEGMRAALFDNVFRGDLMLRGFLLNIIYIAAGFLAFMGLLESARRKGSLLNLGE